jgi:L-lactate dehydrogenase complex protein LldG
VEPVAPAAAGLLRRIRAALYGHEAERPVPPPAPERESIGPQERTDLFRLRLESVGGSCLSAPSPEALLPALGESLRAEGVAALLWPQGDEAARDVAEALVPFGPFTLVRPEEVRQTSPPVSAGIQSAEWAVAETGTVVQTSRGGKSLLPGLLTDVHVALLPPDRLVCRLEDVLAALAGDMPRNVSFLSGPSRTGDIEQTLTVGAHGPRKLIVVLLR